MQPTGQFPISQGMVINGYRVVQLLGTGTFGSVFLANFQGKNYAMKVTWAQSLQQLGPTNANKAIELLQEELAIFKQLCEKPYSNYILQIFRYMRTETPDCRFLVSEYCEYGDLRKFTGSFPYNGRLDEKTASMVLAQVLEGFRLLLAEAIVHRDIKPDNIMMRKTANPQIPFQAVIGDFGSARRTAGYKITTEVGTPQYMAPEVPSGVYTSNLDIFSLGITLYEVLVGKTPWDSAYSVDSAIMVEQKHLYTGNNLRFPAAVQLSSDMIKLLKKMTDPVPYTRITWENLYKHPVVIRGQGLTGLTSNIIIKPVDVTYYTVDGMFCNRIAGKMEIRSYFQMMSSMIELLLKTIQSLNVSYNCSLTEDNKVKLGRFLSLMKMLLAFRARYIREQLIKLSKQTKCLQGVDPASFNSYRQNQISLQNQIQNLDTQEQNLKYSISEADKTLDRSKELTQRMTAFAAKNPADLNFQAQEMSNTERTICQGVLNYSKQFVPNRGMMSDGIFKRQLATFYCMYNYEELITPPSADSNQNNFTIQFELDEAIVETQFQAFCQKYSS